MLLPLNRNATAIAQRRHTLARRCRVESDVSAAAEAGDHRGSLIKPCESSTTSYVRYEYRARSRRSRDLHHPKLTAPAPDRDRNDFDPPPGAIGYRLISLFDHPMHFEPRDSARAASETAGNACTTSPSDESLTSSSASVTNSAITRSGISRFRQLVCPSGHVRSKHGLHGNSSRTTRAHLDSGGVKAGLDEP